MSKTLMYFKIFSQSESKSFGPSKCFLFSDMYRVNSFLARNRLCSISITLFHLVETSCYSLRNAESLPFCNSVMLTELCLIIIFRHFTNNTLVSEALNPCNILNCRKNHRKLEDDLKIWRNALERRGLKVNRS